MERSQVAQAFEQIKKETGATDTAAALLVLSECLDRGFLKVCSTLFDFDHQISMGIRHGLFGTGDHTVTLAGEFTQVAEALEGIEAALSDIAAGRTVTAG